MSLVNDVLRQLDQRQASTEQVMPLQALQVEAVNNAKVSIQHILVLIALILVATLLVQLFYQQPISKLLFPPSAPVEKKTETQVLPAELKGIGLAMKEIESLDDIRASDFSIVDKPVVDKVVKIQKAEVETIKAEVIEVKTAEVKVAAAKKTVLNTLPAPIEIQAPTVNQTNIKRIEIPGLKDYQLALRAYKNKQSAKAMNWVDQAIAEKNEEKYLILKARIFIQKKDGDGLQQFVLAQSLNSLDWFRHVAPGLQMFGFYRLSNQYYSQLVEHQPQQAMWQLAMALNYSKLGLNNKSNTLYQSLSDSSILSKQQKKWVDYQIKRMNTNKVVMNGS